MSYRILLAADDSALSDKALKDAIELAQHNPASMIIGMSMTRPMPADILLTGADMVDYELHEHLLAQRRLDRIAELAGAAGVPCKTMVEHSSFGPENIARLALMHECNCVFVAFRDNGGQENNAFNERAPWKALAEASIPAIIYR